MKRSRHGFSLAEMLTAVAILAILCAIAIPGIIAIRNNLEMRRLDDTAHEIYMAAQNRLTALRSAGTAESIAVPDGQRDAGTGDCWLFNGNPGMSTLLPAGSVEGGVSGGYYAVYYNETSGAVLEVYYSEETSVSGIGAQGLKANYSADKESRKEKKIGFYSGEGSSLSNIVDLPSPTVTIVNGDELTLTVMLDTHDERVSSAKLEITVSDSAGHSTVLYTNPNASTYVQNFWMLDGLDGGEQFKTLFPTLVPGSDITVTAKLSRAPSGTTTYRTSVSRYTENSLFASVDSETGTASVANLRHLQNLHSSFSNVTGSITAAVQTDNIDCSEYQGNSYTFAPISNTALTSFDGQENEIQHLKASAGLFAEFSDGRISNVMLNNPVISGGSNAGALAASLTNTTVSTCQTYGSSSTVSGSGSVGGLIGSASGCTVENCSASIVTVSGNNVGGLIGSMSGGSVSNSYADSGDRGAIVDGTAGEWENGLSGSTVGGLVGSMSSGASVAGSYAVGFIKSASTAAGGIVGGASGGSITNSYSVVTVNGTTKHGIVGNGAPTLSGVCFWAGGCDSDSSMNGKGLDYIESLSGWKKWQETVPYTETVCEAPYLYPMISGLTHYGDWPTEASGEIEMEDEEGVKIEGCIFVPKNGTRTITLFQTKDGETRPVKVDTSNGSFSAVATSDSDSTELTITTKNSTSTGVYAVDVTGDGIKMRLIIIVYDVSITLTPTGGDARTNGTYKTVSNPQRSDGALQLSSTQNTGRFNAAITAQPSADTVRDKCTKGSLVNNLNGAVLSINKDNIEEVLANWEVATPYVVENGGSAIKEEVGVSAPAGSNGPLNVTGQYSGRARVRASWAKDSSAYAECIVEMKGARALIKTVGAQGNNTNGLGRTGAKAPYGDAVTVDDYPYRVTLTPAPLEEVTLTLTPQLFGYKKSGTSMLGTASYSWEVYRTLPGGTETALAKNSDYSVSSTNPGKIVLKDNKKQAEYRIVMTCEYQYTSGGKTVTETSRDEVRVSVLRKAAKTDSSYTQVKLYQQEYKGSSWQEFTGNISVEQISGTDEYAGTNKVKVAAYIDGIVNQRVKWYVSSVGKMGSAPAAGVYTWVDIAGGQGAIPIGVQGGDTRANVQWKSSDAVVNGEKTGGYVEVSGLNTNDFGNQDFVFLLKAETIDAVDNARPSSRTVEVHVKPQLTITPKSRVNIGVFGLGWSTSATFSANRRDATYPYSWDYSGDSGLSIPKTNSYQQTATAANVGEMILTLNYGPFSANASFKGRRLVGNILTAINADGTVTLKENKKDIDCDIFLVEKGKNSELEFSWGSLWSNVYVSSEPSGTSYASITKSTSSAYTTPHEYSVTGLQFTRNSQGTSTPQTLKWSLKYNAGLISLSAGSFDAYRLYVYGVDILKSDGTAAPAEIVLNGLDDSVRLKADTYFPSEFTKSSSLTWHTDAQYEDMIKVAQNGNEATITAKRYSSENYYATVTCEYDVIGNNDQLYHCVKKIPVRVKPTTTLDLSVAGCGTDDIAVLSALFPADNIADRPWLSQEDDGSFILVEDSSFKANVTYLKVIPAYSGGSQLTPEQLADYYLNIYGDASCMDVSTVTKDGIIYLRIKAKPDTAASTMKQMELTLEIGKTTYPQNINYYKAPAISIYQGSTDRTDKSISIASTDSTKTFAGFRAELSPNLIGTDGEPMNNIVWSLSCPKGYQWADYVQLAPTQTVANSNDSTATVFLISSLRPDFRVFLEATASMAESGNTLSSAGYAFAFLPEEK